MPAWRAASRAMYGSPRCKTLCLVAWLAAAMMALGETPQKPPLVWIFNGTPGDPEHHALYEQTLDRFRKVFTTRLSVPATNLTILYGPKSAGYDGVCSRENLFAELHKAVAAATSDQDVWLIFEGHSNPTSNGANFNLAGPDVSARELREIFAATRRDAHLVIIFTTSSSGRFMRWIAGPGRLVVTATQEDEDDNETEFPEVLAGVLEDAASDQNHDGKLSLLEIFNACNAGVKAVYDAGGFMQRERAMLDGNGDGRGTQRPAREDAEPAAAVAFTIAGKRQNFD